MSCFNFRIIPRHIETNEISITILPIIHSDPNKLAQGNFLKLYGVKHNTDPYDYGYGFN